MNNKLKIAFNPEGLWDNVEFRERMKGHVLDENYIVYIVTKSTNNSFLDSVLTEVGIDSDKLYQVANNDFLAAKLDTLKVRIYLTGDNTVVRFVDSISTSSIGILVNSLVDTNKLQMKWLTSLQRWVDIRMKELGINGENC